MSKATKPLVVSKDLVKELQRLALAANENETAYEVAKQRYIRAATDALSSASQFAIALYEFTLEFADTPKLIEDKLTELGLQFKSTSSVFNHIARLAFKNIEEGNAKRTRTHRYATLIERAHQRGLSSKDFKTLVANGLRNAERKLFAEPVAKDTRALKKARDIASKFINEETFELTGAKLAEEIKEGSELQLLAEYKNGKITVYGVVPPSLSDTEAILAKLVASSKKPEKHKHDVMRDMLAVIKLVTKTSDDKATASYKVKENKFYFVVSAKRGTAVLTASSEFDLFQQDITLSVADWGRLLSTLIPLRKHITSIDASASEIVVSVDENEIPDIATWVTEKQHTIAIGKASNSTLLVELKGSQEHLEEPTGRWEPLGTVLSEKIEGYFKFTPTKKYASVDFGDDGAIKFSSLAKLSDDHMLLTKPAYRQLKAACGKMKSVGSELKFEKRKNQLRVTVEVDGITMAAFVGVQ
jgi:hypothetical protein